MMNITLTVDACAALQDLLRKETGSAAFRLREFVSGCGASCRSPVHRILRLTINDDNEEEDITVEVDGIRFVMNALLAITYGISFHIMLDNKKIPCVNSLHQLLHKNILTSNP